MPDVIIFYLLYEFDVIFPVKIYSLKYLIQKKKRHHMKKKKKKFISFVEN